MCCESKVAATRPTHFNAIRVACCSLGSVPASSSKVILKSTSVVLWPCHVPEKCGFDPLHHDKGMGVAALGTVSEVSIGNT